ncbi:sensor histidine kinase [Enterococcus faecalis]|uniref:sensor histidine kinase n=1 Tax=Enterococcus faecalis TaxID=1351 RepID=UPI00287FD691|nr:GHKL domain-containing protein [Enterococcus faecalis]
MVVARRLFIKHEIISSLFSLKEKYSILSVTYIINAIILILIRQYRSYPNYTDIFVLSSIMLICSLVLTFVFSLIISRDQRDKDNIYFSNRISHIEETRLEVLNDFQHDYNNTLLVLMELIKQQSYNEAENYLKELLKYTDKQLEFPNYSSIENVENIEMKNYLLTFYEKCAENGVKLILNTRGKCQPISMNPIDSTRMIAIMTNNALEACKELPYSSINIEFHYFQDTTVISVTNQCLNKLSPKAIVEKGYSSKPGHSGRGLFILNRILREYKAKFDIEYCNDQFIISVTLPNR